MLCILNLFRKCQESSKEGSIGNKQMNPSCKEENENKQILFQVQMSKNCFLKKRKDLFENFLQKLFLLLRHDIRVYSKNYFITFVWITKLHIVNFYVKCTSFMKLIILSPWSVITEWSLSRLLRTPIKQLFTQK